jgi:hypothetical protein
MERTEDIRKILFKSSCQRCHGRWTDKRGSNETHDDINRREDGPALLCHPKRFDEESQKKEKSAEGQISTEWKKELLNWMEEGYTRKGKDSSLRSQQVIEIKRTRVDGNNTQGNCTAFPHYKCYANQLTGWRRSKRT